MDDEIRQSRTISRVVPTGVLPSTYRLILSGDVRSTKDEHEGKSIVLTTRASVTYRTMTLLTGYRSFAIERKLAAERIDMR